MQRQHPQVLPKSHTNHFPNPVRSPPTELRPSLPHRQSHTTSLSPLQYPAPARAGVSAGRLIRARLTCVSASCSSMAHSVTSRSAGAHVLYHTRSRPCCSANPLDGRSDGNSLPGRGGRRRSAARGTERGGGGDTESSDTAGGREQVPGRTGVSSEVATSCLLPDCPAGC